MAHQDEGLPTREVDSLYKTVNAEPKAESSLQVSHTSRGGLHLPRASTLRRLLAQICTILMVICMGVSTFICSIVSHMYRICAGPVVSALKSIAWTSKLMGIEEFYDAPTTDFRGEDRLSDPVQKIHELERKVNMLLVKSGAMPEEREELINAAVCRVDALEAELISTKKALHEALLKQDEFLACIDSQEAAMSPGKKKRWYTRKSLKKL